MDSQKRSNIFHKVGRQLRFAIDLQWQILFPVEIPICPRSVISLPRTLECPLFKLPSPWKLDPWKLSPWKLDPSKCNSFDHYGKPTVTLLGPVVSFVTFQGRWHCGRRHPLPASTERPRKETLTKNELINNST